jgi:hypothetical protein
VACSRANYTITFTFTFYVLPTFIKLVQYIPLLAFGNLQKSAEIELIVYTPDIIHPLLNPHLAASVV